MSEQKQENVFFTFTSPVRAGFLNALEARKFKPRAGSKEVGDPRYDGTFMVPNDSTDLAALKALVVPMLQAIHPGKKVVGRRLTQEEFDSGNVCGVKVPWFDGTKAADKAKAEKKDQEFFRGFTCFKAASKYAPALSAVENGKFTEYNDEGTRASLKRLFYSGAWFVPHLQLHSYKPNGTDGKPGGVGLWLPALMFVKHDKRLGSSGVNAAEVFKGYAGKVVAEDPTAGETPADDEF